MSSLRKKKRDFKPRAPWKYIFFVFFCDFNNEKLIFRTIKRGFTYSKSILFHFANLNYWTQKAGLKNILVFNTKVST